MFCPNCASQNDESQHYCRMCGLRLDAIASELTAQRPSGEMTSLLKRKRRSESLGVVSISTAAVIGLMLVMSKAFYYKLLLLGPELLFGSAIGAVILFMLASVFFFNYPKLFLKLDRSNVRLNEHDQPSAPINKLLTDPPFQPASVTEDTTELLRNKPRQ